MSYPVPTLLYQYGRTSPVVAPVLTAQAVNKGDMVGLSSGNVVRAEDTTWNTNLATTQAAFVTTFLGIAQQVKQASNAQIPGNAGANLIVVETSGVFTAPCASTTFNVGDYVGPAQNGATNFLLSQTVAKVTSAADAIGRVVQAGTNLTQVTFALISQETPFFG